MLRRIGSSFVSVAVTRLESRSRGTIDGFSIISGVERLPGVGLGVEVDGAGECLAGGLDAPEPRSGRSGATPERPERASA